MTAFAISQSRRAFISGELTARCTNNQEFAVVKSIVVLALLSLASASPALAGGALPGGTYECTMDNYIAGDMEIVGSTYKGPAFDRKYDGGPYEFAVDASNNIIWHGPVGGYTEPGFQLIGTRLTKSDAGTIGFQMEIRQDGSDNIHFVTCTPIP